MTKRTLAPAAVICLMGPVAACAAGRPGAPSAGAEPIIGWRGDGTGRYPKATPPTTWDADESKNIAWQAEVGKGLSSPVVVGGRIFLTSEQDLLVCVDRAKGKVLWKKANGLASLPAAMKVKEKRYPSSCGFSTPTPAADAKGVYASYGSGIVVRYDLEGDRKWVRYIDRQQSTEYGRSASPVLAAGKLLVSIGHLIALDAGTGKTLWEAPKAECSYGTPAVARIGGVDVAITPNGDWVRVSNGELLARGLGSASYASPLVQDGVVYFVSLPTVAVKLPAKVGKAIKHQTLWENDELEGELFASPVVCGGLLYCASNEGNLFVLDAETGKKVYQKRLPIPSANPDPGMEPANIYGSLALAGRHVFLGNDAGTALLLAPGRQYKQLAENYLDEGSGATAGFAGRYVYLRGGTRLYCIGAGK